MNFVILANFVILGILVNFVILANFVILINFVILANLGDLKPHLAAILGYIEAKLDLPL